MSVLPKKIYLIGHGEVGKRLEKAFAAQTAALNVSLLVLGRKATFNQQLWDEACDPSDLDSIRMFCMREDDLEGALGAFLPFPQLYPNLILVQNGFLEAIPEKYKKINDKEDYEAFKKLIEQASRILVWFTSKGEFFHQLAPTLAYGPQCQRIKDIIISEDSKASLLGEDKKIKFEMIDDEAEFKKQMIIKGIWNCIVGLPLNYYQGLKIGEMIDKKKEEMIELLKEMKSVLERIYQVEIPKIEELFEIIKTTTAPIAWMNKSGKPVNMETRNGFLLEKSIEFGMQMPQTTKMLESFQNN